MAIEPSQNMLPSETIELLSEQASVEQWTPVIGPETVDLMAHFRIAEVSREQLQGEALRIVSRCVPPDAVEDSETGLVVGYVQSGKTMSYTTVAALARDNGYRMVIVITGTSNRSLSSQVVD